MKSLPASLNAMDLPDNVREAASKTTGMVNFRNVWRNSSRKWCHANRKQIVVLIQRALQLKANDQTRFNLARQIEKLPNVPPPTDSGKYANAAILFTPLIACLDPSKRFPVINGRLGDSRLLSALHLANETLGHQAEGMINLIGQFGISDSFMLDVLADDLAHIPRMVPRRQLRQRRIVRGGEGPGARPLPILDEDDLWFVDERCHRLSGEGKIWEALEEELLHRVRGIRQWTPHKNPHNGEKEAQAS